MHRYFLYAHTIKTQVLTDLIIFKQQLFTKVIDSFIYVTANILVMGYILPAFGLTSQFGFFLLASLLPTSGLFQAYPLVANLVSDIFGPRKISYDLLLPMPSWLVFARIMISASIENSIMSLCIFPFGIILLYPQINALHLNIASFIGMIIMNSVFASSLALLTTSMISGMHKLSSVWTRFLFPLWFFGGFQFSWKAVNTVFPKLSYLFLCNPIVFATEGTRDALLGATGPQGPYISAWICIPILIVSTLVFSFIAIKRLQKRLDFV